MAKTLIFGHKNPDTDTITSAIVYSYLKNQLGFDTEAVRLGNVNGETQYALDTFKVEAPRLVDKVAGEAEKSFSSIITNASKAPTTSTKYA